MRARVIGTVGAVVGLAAVAHRVVTPRQQRWGATEEDVHRPLPGDELVAEPADQSTRAVTIQAPREVVWRWVVQLGADRGGFYSYDWLEDLFGLGIHSADSIVPEWQHREVGDLVQADARGSGGWYVMEVRPPDALVLSLADVREGRPARRQDPAGWEFLWTFALLEESPGTTRLLVRERAGFGKGWVRMLMAPVGLVSFVMTRRMLLGIKQRAEGEVAAVA